MAVAIGRNCREGLGTGEMGPEAVTISSPHYFQISGLSTVHKMPILTLVSDVLYLLMEACDG